MSPPKPSPQQAGPLLNAIAPSLKKYYEAYDLQLSQCNEAYSRVPIVPLVRGERVVCDRCATSIANLHVTSVDETQSRLDTCLHCATETGILEEAGSKHMLLRLGDRDAMAVFKQCEVVTSAWEPCEPTKRALMNNAQGPVAPPTAPQVARVPDLHEQNMRAHGNNAQDQAMFAGAPPTAPELACVSYPQQQTAHPLMNNTQDDVFLARLPPTAPQPGCVINAQQHQINPPPAPPHPRQLSAAGSACCLPEARCQECREKAQSVGRQSAPLHGSFADVQQASATLNSAGFTAAGHLHQANALLAGLRVTDETHIASSSLGHPFLSGDTDNGDRPLGLPSPAAVTLNGDPPPGLPQFAAASLRANRDSTRMPGGRGRTPLPGPWGPGPAVRNADIRLCARRLDGTFDWVWTPDVAMAATAEGERLFSEFMTGGVPLIVRDCLKGRRAVDWRPTGLRRAMEDFHRNVRREQLRKGVDSDSEEEAMLSVLDCKKWEPRKMTEGEFFGAYGKREPRHMLKLKDWPTDCSFEQALPAYYQDFINMLPFPDYVGPNGALNLAAYYPPDYQGRPDLGPKTYIANGRLKEDMPGDSVTKLHVDLSDAVNILMHVQLPLGEEQRVQPRCGATEFDPQDPGRWRAGALWHIFRREDVEKLENYLKRHLHEFRHGKGSVQATAHVIHGQECFLTASHLAALKEEEGIEPWAFEQNEGEAVFIPAGCPHQVRNLTSCIKVAVDFVFPASSAVCRKLMDERRQLVSADFDHSKDAVNQHFADVLQLEVLMLEAARAAIDAISPTLRSPVAGAPTSTSRHLPQQHGPSPSTTLRGEQRPSAIATTHRLAHTLAAGGPSPCAIATTDQLGGPISAAEQEHPSTLAPTICQASVQASKANAALAGEDVCAVMNASLQPGDPTAASAVEDVRAVMTASLQPGHPTAAAAVRYAGACPTSSCPPSPQHIDSAGASAERGDACPSAGPTCQASPPRSAPGTASPVLDACASLGSVWHTLVEQDACLSADATRQATQQLSALDTALPVQDAGAFWNLDRAVPEGDACPSACPTRDVSPPSSGPGTTSPLVRACEWIAAEDKRQGSPLLIPIDIGRASTERHACASPRSAPGTESMLLRACASLMPNFRRRGSPSLSDLDVPPAKHHASGSASARAGHGPSLQLSPARPAAAAGACGPAEQGPEGGRPEREEDCVKRSAGKSTAGQRRGHGGGNARGAAGRRSNVARVAAEGTLKATAEGFTVGRKKAEGVAPPPKFGTRKGAANTPALGRPRSDPCDLDAPLHLPGSAVEDGCGPQDPRAGAASAPIESRTPQVDALDCPLEFLE